ncbi:TolC family protein [Deinococcus koreensis]|uniref:Transporter n=1 Tax=Deinococcus koreensis TaxID=2054903 RepID=A0A2K3UTL2_9DEIO|nr:TolC family protein [Deinococcus koreensis]PNY79884.1 transporter [Deinococcus koreensis]
MPRARLSRPVSTLLSLALLLGPAAAQTAPPAPVTSPAQPTPAPASPAQPAAEPASLTPLLEALRRSPGWRSADLSYRAAQLALDSARTRAGLSLTAGADGGLTRLPWDTGQWQGNASVTLGATLSVLPWAPALEGVRSAQRALDAAAVELRNSRATLTTQLLEAYANARSAADALALADAQLSLSARLLEVARAQRAQGLLTQEALLERQGALEGAQAGQARAARGVALAAQAVARVLGTPVTLPARAAEFAPLPDTQPGQDLAALLARADGRRPEVARARASLADAQANLSATTLDARLPDLSASVRAGQLSDGQGGSGRILSGSLNVKTGVLGAQLSVPLRDTSAVPSGVSLSLSASIPILGGGKGTALAQAQLGVTQAQLGLDSARQSVELDVRTRLGALQDEQGALPAAQTAVTGAQTALDSARARLEAGLGTALDALQAEVGLLQATQALGAQQRGAALAALKLAAATADLDALLTTPAPLPTSPAPAGGRP